MLILPRVVLTALLAVSCSPSGATSAPAPSVSPSLPVTGTVVTGATHELRLGTARLGQLVVSVKATTTPDGTTVQARYTRRVRCRLESGSIGTCTTVYDKRRNLPASAFTYDVTLDRFALTDTVEGQRLTITWTGFGDTTRQPNEAGALLIETRDAVGQAVWGKWKHTDPKSAATTSMLYRRVYAP